MQNDNHNLLPAPTLPQANPDGTLSLAAIRAGIHVTVPVYPGMKVGDTLTVPWEGTPSHPEVGFSAIFAVNDSTQPETYAISYLNVYDKWKQLKVWYNVKGLGDSEAITVAIVP